MHSNVQLNHRIVLTEEACREASGQTGRELRERRWLSCWISRNAQQVGALMAGASGMLLHILSQLLTTLSCFGIPYYIFYKEKSYTAFWKKKQILDSEESLGSLF